MTVDVQHATGTRCHHESVAPFTDAKTRGVWRKCDQHVSMTLDYCTVARTKAT